MIEKFCKKSFLILVLALFAATFWATDHARGETIMVEDMAGRSVSVESPVQRIVCAGPGALRLITYMNVQDKVVGVEEMEKDPTGRPYAYANPSFKTLPVIGPGGPASINQGPDPEATLSCNPDLIFITYMHKNNADRLQTKLGIPVVVLSYGDKMVSEEAVYRSLSLIGRIMDNSRRADDLVKFFEDMKKDLSSRAKGFDQETPSVYVGGIGHRGAHGIESTFRRYLPFEFLGIKSVARNLKGEYVLIDKEMLLVWDPDIIFVDGGGRHQVEEDIRKNSKFYKNLSAFKHGRVYLTLPYNYYTINLGTCFANAYFIGKVVIPSNFNDIDPEKKAEEIYSYLFGEEKRIYTKMKGSFGGLVAWHP